MDEEMVGAVEPSTLHTNVSEAIMQHSNNAMHYLQQQQQQQNVYENFTIHYVLPTSNMEDTSLLFIAAFYALLFMLGTCGNAAILAVVHHVKSYDVRAKKNTTLTYICVLCIVDFLSMLPLPMTIIDQILGFWMFGTFACKLFRLLEHIGKIFSTFILVAFSIDRYCAVCHPLQVRVRNHKAVFLVLISLLAATCVLLFPILLYAHSKELVLHERIDAANQVIVRNHIYKCVDDLGDNLFIVFSLYCFFMAYLIPFIMLAYFYYLMLYRLYKQSRMVRQTLANRRKRTDDKIPLGRIAAYTLAICSFHFLCWTPYWISVLYSMYVEIFNPDQLGDAPTSNFIYFMYGVHALPYINSASNFILYGLLNRQLHNSSDKKGGRGGRGRSPTNAPALRLTECSEMINHPSLYCETTVRTPPSDVSNHKATEHSPLVFKTSQGGKCCRNGYAKCSTTTTTVTTKDSTFFSSPNTAASSNEEESIII